MIYNQEQTTTNDTIPDIMKELHDITNDFQNKMTILRARQNRILTQISNTFEQRQKHREIDGKNDL